MFGETVKAGKEIETMEISGIPGTVYKQTFETMVSQYITVLRGYLAGGFSEKEALEKTDRIHTQEVSVSVETGGSMTHSYLYYFFALAPYILLSMCIVGIVPVLIVFRKKEVRNRIRCSAYPLSHVNRELIFGTITASALFGFLYLLVSFVGGNNGMISMRGLLFAVNMFVFMFVCIGIVFLLGQILKKSSVISMVSNVLALGMSFLTGIFVPLEYLGTGVIKIAHFLPSYWYVLGVRLIDNYEVGDDLRELWKYMGIQILFGTALIAIGLAYSKKKCYDKSC